MKNYLAFVAIPSILNAFSTAVSSASTFKAVSEVPRSHPHWGIGGAHRFIRGGPAPTSKPLPFYIPFLTEKVPL